MTVTCPLCGTLPPFTGVDPVAYVNAHHDLRHARTARDQGIARVTANSDQHDIDAVDRAILTVAARGRPFSANECRQLMPDVRSRALIGARFNALARAGRIRRHRNEYVPSTDVATHGHDVKVWISADAEEKVA